MTPMIAIHQICQISAKPMTTAKKEMKIPTALWRGNSMACQRGVSVGAPDCRWACFMAQKASVLLTCGRTEKFQAGGGEEVDHSRVRPFHGSPVRSRRASR